MSVVARSRPALTHAATSVGLDVEDVAAAGVDLRDLRCVDVEAGHVEPGLGELHGQRQADVAETDDADPRLPLLDLLLQVQD